MKRSLIFVLFLSLLVACAPSPEEIASQTALAATSTASAWTATPTSTYTPTPTVTPSPTYTPTPTITPTPLGGSENIIFAHFDKRYFNDGTPARSTLTIEMADKTLKLPLDAETLKIPLEAEEGYIGLPSATTPITISSDGTLLATLIGHVILTPTGGVKYFTNIIIVDLTSTSPIPTVLATIEHGTEVGFLKFSPDNKWLLFGRYLYINLETQEQVKNYDCRWNIALGFDNTVYCNPNMDLDLRGKVDLTDNTIQKPLLVIPRRKLWSKTSANWFIESILPSQDAFVILKDRGKDDSYDEDTYMLIHPLSGLETLEEWEWDLDIFINAQPFAIVSGSTRVLKYLFSPDGKKVAVTAINNDGEFGAGSGPDERTFTFVTPIDQTYYLPDPEESGVFFYALAWSPDSTALIGIAGDGQTLSIYDAKTMTEIKVLYRSGEQVPFWHFNEEVYGANAVWIP